MTGNLRHFLDIDLLDKATLRRILDNGLAYKRKQLTGRPLIDKTLALIFEKPSTRTRVSFEIGMRQLGGDVVVLDSHGSQLGRGETVGDTARVLSRYVDAIMIRTDDAAKLNELVEHGNIPIINGLTDRTHPCQIMADIMTFEEHRGSITGRVIAWSGDGNNVANSWIQAAARFDFELRLACPDSLMPLQVLVDRARAEGARVSFMPDPQSAVRDADCVVTDTWVSMNHQDRSRRIDILAPYRVDGALMALAKPDALFMHCLPAHRGEEVTDGVIDGPHSVVWDEAENRLHIQKAILAWCLAE
ncbi:MAG: ornithine carbamoyltransferase [Rhodospirillaceae bacterium]